MTTGKPQDMSDDELVAEAQHGFRGQGAIVEMMRRLRDSLVAQQEATNRLSSGMLGFTVGIAAMTLVLLILTLVLVWRAL